VLPGKIKLKNKRMMERKRTETTMIFLKKKTISCSPWNNKREGKHDREDEVQVIEGTCEIKAVVEGKMDTEKPMEFDFVIEWDEPKEQVYEAMTSNAKELTNLIMSLLTLDKERQQKEIIKNKK
jgi:hypothetical protein